MKTIAVLAGANCAALALFIQQRRHNRKNLLLSSSQPL
jgi:hypothetical protein